MPSSASASAGAVRCGAICRTSCLSTSRPHATADETMACPQVSALYRTRVWAKAGCNLNSGRGSGAGVARTSSVPRQSQRQSTTATTCTHSSARPCMGFARPQNASCKFCERSPKGRLVVHSRAAHRVLPGPQAGNAHVTSVGRRSATRSVHFSDPRPELRLQLAIRNAPTRPRKPKTVHGLSLRVLAILNQIEL